MCYELRPKIVRGAAERGIAFQLKRYDSYRLVLIAEWLIFCAFSEAADCVHVTTRIER